MYLVTEGDLDKLLSGEIKKEDLIKPENRALITYSGEDLKQLLEPDGKKLSDKELEEVVDMVRHGLDHCDCWMCIDSALDSV